MLPQHRVDKTDAARRSSFLPHLTGACSFHWQRAVDQSPYQHFLSRSNESDSAHKAVLVHVGKAGGSTIGQYLRSLHACYDEVHLQPLHVETLTSYATVIFTARDPISRFLSAFHWDNPERTQTRDPMRSRLDCWPSVDDFAKSLDVESPASSRPNGCPLARQALGLLATPAPRSMQNDMLNHVYWNSCFYTGGSVTELCQHGGLFVTQAETMFEDLQQLIPFLFSNAAAMPSQPAMGHARSSLGHVRFNVSRSLSASSREALEIALQDEYRVLNILIRHSVNKKTVWKQAQYCTDVAHLPGVCCRNASKEPAPPPPAGARRQGNEHVQI